MKISSQTTSTACQGSRFRARLKAPMLLDTRRSSTRCYGGAKSPKAPCTTIRTAVAKLPRPSKRCHIINCTTTAGEYIPRAGRSGRSRN